MTVADRKIPASREGEPSSGRRELRASIKRSEDSHPEDELLLRYIRTFMGFERGAAPQVAAVRGVDWEGLFERADRQKVLPLLYMAIKRSDDDQVPQEWLNRLRAEFDRNAIFNLSMTGELLGLLDLFEGRGIEAIPFKGPSLSSLLYRDISLRQFLDLDVLVPLDRVSEVRDLLISRGYVPSRQMRPAEERAHIRYQHHHHFYSPDRGINLEIHWRISPRIYSFDLEPSELRRRAKLVRIAGREVLSLSPEDTILILCEHATRHYWRRLAWICDVAALAASDEVEWKTAVQRARDLGCERVLFVGLLLAEELLKAPIPSEISGMLGEDETASSLAAEAVEMLFGDRSPPCGSADRLGSSIGEELFYIRARERLRDRSLYYLRRATYPTEEDWDRISLPEDLSFLYRLMRPFRMIGKYRLAIWKWFLR